MCGCHALLTEFRYCSFETCLLPFNLPLLLFSFPLFLLSKGWNITTSSSWWTRLKQRKSTSFFWSCKYDPGHLRDALAPTSSTRTKPTFNSTHRKCFTFLSSTIYTRLMWTSHLFSATGREVFDWILDQGYYSERDTSNVMRQVLEAVAYLHSLKIVHRNLKVYSHADT